MPYDWLNLDYFSGVLLVTVYRLPDELDETTLVAMLTDSCDLSAPKSGCRRAVVAIVLQRRDLPSAPATVVYGSLPETVVARRKQLAFELSFAQQNVGYFLDIEPVRRWLEANAGRKRILNLFSYTCAFSVVAIAAGATAVVNIDLSKRSLKRGRRNHVINALPVDRAIFLAHDIFKSWGKLRRLGPYDIVIVDPPSFQKGSFVADKDYPRLMRRMAAMISDGGHLIACLNAPEISKECFRSWINDSSAGFRQISSLDAHADFPEAEPDRSLKMLIYQRDCSPP